MMMMAGYSLDLGILMICEMYLMAKNITTNMIRLAIEGTPGWCSKRSDSA